MTRINLVHPEELFDQHLIAEYKEILQLCGCLKRTLQSKTGLVKEKIPKEFTLNKGHVYFFYDKGLYLFERFNSLKQELIKRGFSVSKEFPVDAWPKDLYNNWVPNKKDLEIVRERINSKISIKPSWYKYYGK